MAATWPINDDRLEELSRQFLPLFQKVGAERFDAGVSTMIQERPAEVEGFRLGFPIPSELRKYIPLHPAMTEKQARESAEWRDLYRERNANPDAFFGEADVVAMMRIVRERSASELPIDPVAIVDEVLQIRKIVQERIALASRSDG